jgi:protein phosphatase
MLNDLPETERSHVRDGIMSTDGLTGARGVVERLRERRLAPCPPPPTEPPLTFDPTLPGLPPLDTTPLPTPSPEPGTNCRSVS